MLIYKIGISSEFRDRCTVSGTEEIYFGFTSEINLRDDRDVSLLKFHNFFY